MSELIGVLVCFLIIMVQYFLSTRNKAIYGALLPVVYTIVWTCMAFYLEFSTITFLLALVGGLVMLLSAWDSGRNAVKRKLEKEMEIEKVKDVK